MLNECSVSMSDSTEKIMEATYEALSENGYADLSIQKIADKSDMAKSAIYYHFDDKEELVIEFLDYVNEQLEIKMQEINNKESSDQLEELIDLFLNIEDDEMWGLHKAFFELRNQALTNEKLRAEFKQFDRDMKEKLQTILVKNGVSDPDKISNILLSTIDGSIARFIIMDDKEGLEEMKNHIKELAKRLNEDL